MFIDIDGIREERKTFLLLLVYACVVGAVLTGYTYFAGSVQTQMGESAGYQDDRKNFGAEKGQAGEMGDKQPVYVQTPDMYALNLTMTDIYINDCYSSNETNEKAGSTSERTIFCMARRQTIMENWDLGIHRNI